ncbi:hypothetical protein [Shimia marina]|uniref:Opacity protein antigens n=1 Tax=Shimia marina TaxID=321267 RepID=A0A0P1ET18_9RHOB|nr:hypothetical protein [Shimia marina]CUH53701.1 hypothetical protein SHM7688_03160 [Shimia marina]SFD70618.1 hypothetical protein SAMN04488037_102110 [Shimia marina]
MKKHIFAAAVVSLISGGGAVQAEPAFGFGLSYVFGGDWALGVRVFHDNEPDEVKLALGADYKFGSGSFRPTVGVAYLADDYYLDLSLGYDTGTQALDYGLGLGASFETEEPESGGSPDVDPSDVPTTGPIGCDTATAGLRSACSN